MAFIIQFYENTSEKNKVDKSISSVFTLAGNLRDGSSIINPVVLVELGAPYTNIMGRANYAHIADFGGRYYFITDIRAVRTRLFEISMRVDVLMSYSSQIKTNTAIIKRQEKEWNLYLDDGTFRTYQNPNVITKTFPNGFSSLEFVLAVAGN